MVRDVTSAVDLIHPGAKLPQLIQRRGEVFDRAAASDRVHVRVLQQQQRLVLTAAESRRERLLQPPGLQVLDTSEVVQPHRASALSA
ncbi:MAG: hypothetical protein AUH85_03495 [Chloroflexi bacterium 13_1_40CM_4_68_4]|nr:MAG: hypothetical protein AUH85_03495 [Chloroflexi bacterium 13_1_40CM_4_68_4]